MTVPIYKKLLLLPLLAFFGLATACGGAVGGGSSISGGGNLTGDGPVDLPIIMAKDIIPGIKDVTFDDETSTLSFTAADDSNTFKAQAFIGDTADGEPFAADDDSTYRYVVADNLIANGAGATTTALSFVLTNATLFTDGITAGTPTTLVIQHNPAEGTNGYYITIIRSNVNNLFDNITGSPKPFGFINSNSELKLFYPTLNTDNDYIIATQRVSDGYIAQLTTTTSLVDRVAYSEYASKILLVGDDNAVSYWNGSALSTISTLSIGDNSVFAMDPKGHHIVYSKLNGESRYVLAGYTLGTSTALSFYDDETTYDYQIITQVNAEQTFANFIALDAATYTYHFGSIAPALAGLGNNVGIDDIYFDDTALSFAAAATNVSKPNTHGGFYISEGNIYLAASETPVKVLDYDSYNVTHFDMALNGSYLILSRNNITSPTLASSEIYVCPMPTDYTTLTANSLNAVCYFDGMGDEPVTSKTNGNELTYAVLFAVANTTQVTARTISTTDHATPYSDIAMASGSSDISTFKDTGVYLYSPLSSISGGEAPYSCEITNGGAGTLDPDTCVLTITAGQAAENPTLPIMRMSDAGGNSPVDITTVAGEGGGTNGFAISTVTTGAAQEIAVAWNSEAGDCVTGNSDVVYDITGGNAIINMTVNNGYEINFDTVTTDSVTFSEFMVGGAFGISFTENGTSSFAISLTGLLENKTYHVDFNATDNILSTDGDILEGDISRYCFDTI